MNELSVRQRLTPLDQVFYALGDGSPRTHRNRMASLRAFAKWTRSGDVRAAVSKLLTLSRGQAFHLVRLWRKSLQSRGLHVTTINNYVEALRKVVALAKESEIVTWELNLSALPENRNRDERMERCSYADYKRVQGGINGNGAFALRDRAILRCLWDWALRRLELTNLNVQDIDLRSGKFKLLGKGEIEPATYTFPCETMEAIKAWLDVRGHHPGPLFVGMDRVGNGGEKPINPGTIWRIVRTRGQAAGVLNLHPHAIRAAAATYALECGRDIHEVSCLMRHRKPETTMRYFRRPKKAANRLARWLASK